MLNTTDKIIKRNRREGLQIRGVSKALLLERILQVKFQVGLGPGSPMQTIVVAEIGRMGKVEQRHGIPKEAIGILTMGSSPAGGGIVS